MFSFILSPDFISTGFLGVACVTGLSLSNTIYFVPFTRSKGGKCVELHFISDKSLHTHQEACSIFSVDLDAVIVAVLTVYYRKREHSGYKVLNRSDFQLLGVINANQFQ